MEAIFFLFDKYFLHYLLEINWFFFLKTKSVNFNWTVYKVCKYGAEYINFMLFLNIQSP